MCGITGVFNLNGAQAVSYTHLRAHETVLDLVCRLLLEKKKATIMNYIIRMHHQNTKRIQLDARRYEQQTYQH